MIRTPRPIVLPALLCLSIASSASSQSGAAASTGSPTDERRIAAPAPGSATARFRALVADDWQRRLREDPLMATEFGDRRYNGRLPSVGLADQRRMLEADRAEMAVLRSIGRDSLAGGDLIDYDVFRRLREDEVAEGEFHGYLIPITNREGFHTFFPELPERVPLATVRDYEDYTARLAAFLGYVAQHGGACARVAVRRGDGDERGALLRDPPRIVGREQRGAARPRKLRLQALNTINQPHPPTDLRTAVSYDRWTAGIPNPRPRARTEFDPVMRGYRSIRRGCLHWMKEGEAIDGGRACICNP
ncbi:MAG: hypothetical protein JWM27_3972 [Gemmatimonadetes bacterium]|nr:hypothetical protein [Gemmatimonadota bacterium]